LFHFTSHHKYHIFIRLGAVPACDGQMDRHNCHT